MAVPDNVTLDSAYTQIGDSSADGTSQNVMADDRSALLSLCGYDGEPGTFLDWLWDYFTVFPAPDGSTVNAYAPDNDGIVSLIVNGVRYEAEVGGLMGDTPQPQAKHSRRSNGSVRIGRPPKTGPIVSYRPRFVREQSSRRRYLDRMLTRIRAGMDARIEADVINAERQLWHLCRKWGVSTDNKSQWQRFLNFRHRADVRGPRKPKTIYGPLTFTDSDSVALTTHDGNWTVQTGVWSIKTNAAAATTAGMAYYSSFADDDMTVDCTIANGGLANGPAARCSTSAYTCYMAEMFTTTTCQGAKIVAGTRTFLFNVAPNQSADSARVLSIDVSGTAIQGDYGTSTGSTTDSAISAIDNPGMIQRTSSGIASIDNWNATDGIADAGGASQLTTLGVG